MGRWSETMASKFVKGTYVSGCGHSVHRPNFYRRLRMWQGTINIQLMAGTDEHILIPNERVQGADPIDKDQYFLVRRCRLKGVAGYQILPIDKRTNIPQGHHASKTIEITLEQRIELKEREELEVELEGF